MLAQFQTIVLAEAAVIFLGDGEFDGIVLQAELQGYGLQYVCRTALNLLVTYSGGNHHVASIWPSVRPR